MPKAPAWLRVVREASALPAESSQISNAKDVFRLMRDRAAAEPVECFWVLTLNAQNYVTAVQEVTRGILNSSLVHPREVFWIAINQRAASIIVAHNHPSGVVLPSADDRAVTAQLVEAGRILDIPVYDHLILAADHFFSFAEAGLL